MKRQKNRKGNFLRRSYREAWEYIKDSRNFIYTTMIVFLFFVLLGFFTPAPAKLNTIIIGFIDKLLQQTEGLSQAELIRFIFWNNIQSSFTGMLLGIFLGIFPVMSALANGYLLGFVASKTVDGNGLVILWRLFPHGIFELPALFISLGMGLRLGTSAFAKNKFRTLKYYIINSIKTFFLIVVPLLVIAAIIEGSLISLLG